MEVLKNYVDNIFTPYEVDDNSTRLKNDILSHMEEEFLDLKDSDLSENEIVGTIVTRFGSFEDISKDLKLKSDENKITEEDEKMISEYKEFSSRYPKLIAAGVTLCIMAVAISGAVSYFTEGFILPLIFFTPVAIGVALFIIAGVKKSYYVDYFKSRSLTQYYDTEEYGLPISQRNSNYRKLALLESSIHGILWLGLIIMYLTLGFTSNLWHPGWIIFVLGGLLSGVIGIIFNFLKNK